uniref:Uncharacterized protein n=1 Tax=Heterorhabditis bacteriophora TaxID=37862 RepID=A0A1I7WL72_HETBA
MQSLAFRGSPCDQQNSNCDTRVSGLNEVRSGLKNKKVMDLSLITEEPEDTQNLDMFLIFLYYIFASAQSILECF